MRKLLELLAGLFGCAVLLSFGYAVLEDVNGKSANHAFHPQQLAVLEQLAALEDVNNGWFPHLESPLYDWEEDLQGWELLPTEMVRIEPFEREDLPSSTRLGELKLSDELSSSGRRALQVPLDFPTPVSIQRSASGLQGVRLIAFDLYMPKDYPSVSREHPETASFVGCLFFLQDKDGRWFQARPQQAILPGQWNTVLLDIRGGSPDVTPLGHKGHWEENQASQVVNIGITFYGNVNYSGWIALDNFRGWLRADRFKRIAAKALERANAQSDEVRANALSERLAVARRTAEEPLKLQNLQLLPPAEPGTLSGTMPKIPRYRAYALTFELNRQIRNPFDPNEVEISGLVETPSGALQTVYAFWYQDYRRENRYESETLTPVGRPHWRIRYTPSELGAHSLRLHVRLRGGTKEAEELVLPPLEFVATPSSERGFIRVSQKDPRYFEYDDGSFCYLVGHNMHTPVDLRCWSVVFNQVQPQQRGLRLYESFLPQMQSAGQNLMEVWMAAWWLAIEWTAQWPGFHGVGRYSLENAWRLDRLFDEAERHGINLHLVLDNHGKFSQWTDFEWDDNPFNSAQKGGLVDLPSAFFADPESRRLHKQRLRYILSRWGGRTNLMGFELVSEYDLVGDGSPNNGSRAWYRTAPAQDWVREMLDYIRSIDPYKHLRTNHYASDFKYVDLQLANSEHFDYVALDAYRSTAGFASMAVQTDGFFKVNLSAPKPWLITEFGGDWNATSLPRLQADLHCGLWSIWMTHSGGTPLFWWYDVISQTGLFPHFRAFANYIAGEDKRRLDAQTVTLTVAQSNVVAQDVLSGLALVWNEGAYAWVYNVQAMRSMPTLAERVRHEKAQTQVSGLESGKYRVEYWDTLRGEVIERQAITVGADRTARLTLPVFVNDLAMKIKPE